MLGRFLARKAAAQNAVIQRDIDADEGGSRIISLSAEQAIGVMAVFAANRVIAEDVAKLPAKVKQRQDGKETRIATEAPEHRIVSQIGKMPSGEDDGFTPMEWIEAVIADAALHGVGVLYLNRVGGRAREVVPIPRGRWQKTHSQWRVNWRGDRWEDVRRSDLMILRGPMLGQNITQTARQAIDLARRMDEMMTGLAKKAGRPNGLISVERLNSRDKAETFLSRITEFFGPTGRGGLMPVDLGQLHYTRLSMSPQELEQSETYARTVTQIASAYRVQPARLMHAITEHNNASAYTWNIIHVQDCIMPWRRRFTERFGMDVLGPELMGQGYFLDISLQGLLQGSPSERSDLYMALRTVGAMSPKTVAELEDLPSTHVSDDPAFPLLTNPNPKGQNDATQDDA